MSSKTLVICTVGALTVSGVTSIALAQHSGDPQGALLYEHMRDQTTQTRKHHNTQPPKH